MKMIEMTGGLALCALLLGCTAENANPANSSSDPQSAFFERLTSLCGKAFAGGLVSRDEADADMAGKAMTMHVASCSDSEIKIPFHIAATPGKWNRSRTWIITRTQDAGGTGLRLKHDHRHEDGTSDEITMYGGDTAAGTKGIGSAKRQEFPVDAESISMFKKGGLAASVTNIWAVEVSKDTYAYQLSRHNRNFRVEFDLGKPIPAPPLPWGWEG